MEKQKLIKLISNDFSISKLAKFFNKSKSSIRYWLKKFELKTNYISKKSKLMNKKYKCKNCNILKDLNEFYFRKNRNTYYTICKKCHNIKKSYKKDFVNYKGSYCEICNIKSNFYNIYDFHHKDPLEKEFNITKYINTRINEKIRLELDKCHLLCSNCHREVHGGLHPNFILRKKINENILNLENGQKVCGKCKIKKPFDSFYKYKKNGKFYKNCKLCHNKNPAKRLRNLKIKCVNYKGGMCKKCGYNKFIGSLDFHHIEPEHKDFMISHSFTSFNNLHKKELDKCILLCSNCHRIEHSKKNN